ncbi:MAG: TrkH family potassium uptake protein [Thermodesulfobacteriota bacterium]|nr:MAG: TrkH family potassium uptake protein [Thermodesulfobacteriota bacterium]
MNIKIVLNIVSLSLIIFSVFMLFPIGISFIYKTSEIQGFLISFFITFLTGISIYFLTRKYKHEELRYREAFAGVTLTWISVAFFGSLPYLLTGALGSFTDAYFEAMSGFTTTGASVIANVEILPKGILFWRGITQWIGGMGIVVFALAVLPVLGTGGMQLFKAEVPGITVDKIRPRIVDTAKLLWLIYSGLTAIIAGLYAFCGMSWYDAICHAFTTISTGGFSTKNTSLASFNSPLIEYIAGCCMLLGSINFVLYFFLLKGDFNKIFKNNEIRFYFSILLFLILIMTLNLKLNIYHSLEKSFRYTFFQIISIITTTGYATADYAQWNFFAQTIILFLMFLGGMVGSTAGGIKQLRIYLMLKQIYKEFYHLIHPRAITSIKINDRALNHEILESIWGFIFLALTIWIISSIIISATGLDMVTSISTVASALNNVGPALGKAGPTSTYAPFPALAKWVLVFCMLIGRLEYYTVLVLFIPAFWKK